MDIASGIFFFSGYGPGGRSKFWKVEENDLALLLVVLLQVLLSMIYNVASIHIFHFNPGLSEEVFLIIVRLLMNDDAHFYTDIAPV